MQSDNVLLDNYIIANQRLFPSDKVIYLREKLSNVPSDELDRLLLTNLKDPSTFLLLSIFLGIFGVDRFLLGDIGFGLIKLLTFGGFGVLVVFDWFSIVKRTKEQNFNHLILNFN